MKKIITIFISYIVIFFIICLGISLLIKQMPVLIPGEEISFRFNRAFLWFYNALPAIIFSGFTIACSVHWRKDGESLFIRDFFMSLINRTLDFNSYIGIIKVNKNETLEDVLCQEFVK
jgi:hypothetical protein